VTKSPIKESSANRAEHVGQVLCHKNGHALLPGPAYDERLTVEWRLVPGGCGSRLHCLEHAGRVSPVGPSLDDLAAVSDGDAMPRRTSFVHVPADLINIFLDCGHTLGTQA